MIRKFVVAFGAAALIAAPSLGAPCKDAKTGKFIKCPTAAATVKASSKTTTTTKTAPMAAAKPATKTMKSTTVRCRNAKGQFAKCGTAGAKAM